MRDPRVTPSAIDNALLVLGGVVSLWALACVDPGMGRGTGIPRR